MTIHLLNGAVTPYRGIYELVQLTIDKFIDTVKDVGVWHTPTLDRLRGNFAQAKNGMKVKVNIPVKSKGVSCETQSVFQSDVVDIVNVSIYI